MTQTFTPSKLNASTTREHKEPIIPEFEEPSALTLHNILSYSRNLEIRPSVMVKEFQLMKS